MFKRIKNLLDISRYTVEELRAKEPEVKRSVLSSTPAVTMEYSYTPKPAHIINLKSDDEFYDSLEQSSNDSTSRD